MASTRLLEEEMDFTYDIFRKFAAEHPIWIESVQGLETCKSRIHDLIERNAGEYFAFDSVHSRVVALTSEPATVKELGVI